MREKKCSVNVAIIYYSMQNEFCTEPCLNYLFLWRSRNLSFVIISPQSSHFAFRHPPKPVVDHVTRSFMANIITFFFIKWSIISRTFTWQLYLASKQVAVYKHYKQTQNCKMCISQHKLNTTNGYGEGVGRSLQSSFIISWQTPHTVLWAQVVYKYFKDVILCHISGWNIILLIIAPEWTLISSRLCALVKFKAWAVFEV